MGHPLDDMLAKLKVVREGDVEAYRDPYDYEYGNGWGDLCAEEVALARMIFRLEPTDLGDHFWNDVVRDDGPEFPDEITDAWLDAKAQESRPGDWATLARAWLLSLDGLLKGCQTPLVPPEQLLSASFSTDWCGWSFHVEALTERIAAVGHSNPETTGPLGVLLAGFVDRRTLYRSTALLAQHNFPVEATDRFAGDDFWGEISATGLPLPELYRILLAGAGRGGSRILTLDEDALKSYREPDMVYGFQEMAERVTPRGGAEHL
jgi:hypothetical protein